MATKKFLELQGHSDEDLRVELASAAREYQQLRFDHYTKGVQSVSRIRELRRDIARIKTENRRRELAALNEGQGRTPKATRRARLQAKKN